MEDSERWPRWLELAFDHWEVSAVLLLAGTAYLIHLLVVAIG